MERLSRFKKTRRVVAEINVVPYIDVMLVLLIIFMITAPLLQTGIEVDLPVAQAKSVDLGNQKPLVITIDSKGTYYLNRGNEKKSRNINEIYALLKVLHDNENINEVLVKSDKSIAYGVFVKAMETAKKAGMEKVGLLTENE